MRASSVPTLFSCCSTNAVVIFCSLHGSVFAVYFAILRSHFCYRQKVPKMGACSPKKWDRLGSFFEVCCIKVAEAQRFGFNEALWLMAAGTPTREALLSEAGFEKVFRTPNWVRRRKLFCR